ncbi:hypothetical protein C8R46DRAFT_1025874 [Mycena filopes]|nr:hypothetical protein C8R46DRAFT_1025874 [Mycena filopes]
MQNLSAEVQLLIVDNLCTCDLASLALVSQELCAVTSTILFTAVSIDIMDLAAFQAAVDNRFKACSVRSISIGDHNEELQVGTGTFHHAFIVDLHKILQPLKQIRKLDLDLTMHSKCYLGCNIVSNFQPETPLCWHFEHLEDFRYTTSGNYEHRSDSIHLPKFINSHPTLKRLQIRLSTSYRYHPLAMDTVLSIPQLEWLEAPAGHFACIFASPSCLRKIGMIFPINISLEPMDNFLQNNTLLPHVEDITVSRQWVFSNVDILTTIAINFGKLRFLDIQGKFWMGFENALVAQLLTEFRQLEVFQIGKRLLVSGDEDVPDEETEIMAYPKLAKVWKNACLSLRKIRIKISGKIIPASRDWEENTNPALRNL